MHSREIDPTTSVEGVIGEECFLCGKEIMLASDRFTWGKKPESDFDAAVNVELPAHGDCLQTTDPRKIVLEFQRRLHDLVGVRRPN